VGPEEVTGERDYGGDARQAILHRLREGEVRLPLLLQEVLDAPAQLGHLGGVRREDLPAERRERSRRWPGHEEPGVDQGAPPEREGAPARIALRDERPVQTAPLRRPGEAPGVGEDERRKEVRRLHDGCRV
jgi:hypothetical protein